jgi:hypothetical protein
MSCRACNIILNAYKNWVDKKNKNIWEKYILTRITWNKFFFYLLKFIFFIKNKYVNKMCVKSIYDKPLTVFKSHLVHLILA